MADLLNLEKINSLLHPLQVKLIGGDSWELLYVCVETGCLTINVCGMLQHGHIEDVSKLIDGDGTEYDIDEFYSDYEEDPQA